MIKYKDSLSQKEDLPKEIMDLFKHHKEIYRVTFKWEIYSYSVCKNIIKSSMKNKWIEEIIDDTFEHIYNMDDPSINISFLNYTYDEEELKVYLYLEDGGSIEDMIHKIFENESPSSRYNLIDGVEMNYIDPSISGNIIHTKNLSKVKFSLNQKEWVTELLIDPDL